MIARRISNGTYRRFHSALSLIFAKSTNPIVTSMAISNDYCCDVYITSNGLSVGEKADNDCASLTPPKKERYRFRSGGKREEVAN
jgi:hypothetical protein